MQKIRVLIVDDSSFSRDILKAALNESEFEVCGIAANGNEGIKQYGKLRPDVVTMDFTMPDMDGMDCSRRIIAQDPAARIVMISSMKDDTLANWARLIGVRWFLQKPVAIQELSDALRSAARSSTAIWSTICQDQLQQALEDYLRHLATDTWKLNVLPEPPLRIESQGLCVIIGVTGTHRGRIVVDTSLAVATALAEKALGKTAVEAQVLDGFSEMVNVISGRGVSKSNSICPGMELRVTPPSLIEGSRISVSTLRMNTRAVEINASFGRILQVCEFAED